jgi:hypothetical protein
VEKIKVLQMCIPKRISNLSCIKTMNFFCTNPWTSLKDYKKWGAIENDGAK